MPAYTKLKRLQINQVHYELKKGGDFSHLILKKMDLKSKVGDHAMLFNRDFVKANKYCLVPTLKEFANQTKMKTGKIQRLQVQ